MRLAGRTSYVTPSAGGRGGVQRGGAIDIAHALGVAARGTKWKTYARGGDDGRLGAALAMAMACPALANLEALEALGVPRITSELEGTWRYGVLIAGAKRYRVRVVLADVLAHMIHRPRAVPVNEAARAVRMRRSTYNTLYRYIDADLRALAQTVAADACDYLFGG